MKISVGMSRGGCVGLRNLVRLMNGVLFKEDRLRGSLGV